MEGAPPGASTVTPGAAAMPCSLADCCVMVDATPSAPISKVFCAQHAARGQTVLQAIVPGHGRTLPVKDTAGNLLVDVTRSKGKRMGRRR
jgi:hypothetical protein